MKPTSFEPLPLTFRRVEVDRILSAISAGDSVSLVGIGSAGKSNLLRFLQREDLRRARLGPDGEQTLFIYVDANKLLKWNLWGMAELIIHQLLVELTGHGVDPEAIQVLDELHARATAPGTRKLAMRYLDRGVALACNRLGLRLVFLFDEFDALGQRLPRRAFHALRALRDDHKYGVIYITASRLEINRLRSNPSEIEAFEELVSPCTVWLGPYGEEDARFMLQRLASRYGTGLEEHAVGKILRATGGHPGLLGAAFRLNLERRLEEDGELEQALLRDSRIQDECLRIWRSLPRSDQEALAQIAGGAVPRNLPEENLIRLQKKGLLGGEWSGEKEIFASVLKDYLREKNPAAGTRFYVDAEKRVVWAGEWKIEGLSRLEYELASYLIDHQGNVCSKDDLIAHLYPDEVRPDGEIVSDERLTTLVKRLRKEIEPAPKKPRYLLTARGVGFQLVDGENIPAE